MNKPGGTGRYRWMWKTGLLIPILCPSPHPVRPRRAGGVYALTLLPRGSGERWGPGDGSSDREGAAARGEQAPERDGGADPEGLPPRAAAQLSPARANPHQPNPGPAARTMLPATESWGAVCYRALLQPELTDTAEVCLEQEGETPGQMQPSDPAGSSGQHA